MSKFLVNFETVFDWINAKHHTLHFTAFTLLQMKWKKELTKKSTKSMEQFQMVIL